MNNALKKINARVKVLQKKHPKSKRTTLQKQAGREWKSGKLRGAVGAVRKKAAKKTVRRKSKPRKRAVKRARVPRKRSLTHVLKALTKPKRKRVYKAKVVSVRKYKATRYRRVSGMGKMSSLVPIVAIAGLGILAYYLINKQTQVQFPPTNNPYRAQAQNSILSWAAAAGLTATAIANIINAINNSDDATVINQAAAPQQYFNPLGQGI